MTISCTNRGTAASNASSATTYAFSPASNYAAGSLAVLCVSADNSVSGGATNNVTSVTDSLGNTWLLAQKPIFDNGAASAGIQGLIAYTTMGKGNLTTGTTITVTFGTAVPAKSYALFEVVPTSGLLATYKTGGVQAGAAVTAAGTYTVTTGSIAVGNLVICTVAMESGTGQTYTADSDATNGSWSTVQYSEVGTTTTGNCIGAQSKVQTTTGSTQSYDVTLAEAADSVGAWAEFTEVNPVVLADKDLPTPTHKRQSGFTDIAVNLLLTTLGVAAATNYTVREPLIVPIKHRSTTQQVEIGPNLLTTTLAGGGDVTLALSGTAVTVSAGTLTPIIGVTAALTGTAVTASAGTLAPSTGVALAGQAVTASAGTVGATAATYVLDATSNWGNPERSRRVRQPTETPNLLTSTLAATGNVTAGLTGTAATGSAGTLAPSASVALAGSSSSSSAGTISPANSLAIAGTAATASSGTLGPAISLALTGQAVTASAGTITASTGSNVTVALTGTEVTIGTGTLSPSLSLALSGQALTSSAGTLTPSTGTVVALTGTAVTVSAGNLAKSTSVALTGAESAIAAGTISPALSKALTGQSVTSIVGILTPTLTLNGIAVTSFAGTAAPSITIALSGQAVTASAGNLVPPFGVLIGSDGRTIESRFASRTITADGAERIITVRSQGRTIQ
jgi:hypothetical protein